MASAELLDRAARAIVSADALLVTAGAGMGVDSGLPDFRGPEGFWRAYPAYERLGLAFEAMANPRWFAQDPELAWGFYGHRTNLYRKTTPHDGFGLLRELGASKPAWCFVFTSNVDGHFAAAGFDPERIVECHGALSHLQCTARCGVGLFEAPRDAATGAIVEVDVATFRAKPPLPACPACGKLARPNVLMFGDMGWDERRTQQQEWRFRDWLTGLHAERRSLTIVECGAGTAIPTVREIGQRLMGSLSAKLVRINVRESEGPRGTLSIPMGARAALVELTKLARAAVAQ